jgi:hypothetical protein
MHRKPARRQTPCLFQRLLPECHNAKKQKGKVRLDDISFSLDSVEKRGPVAKDAQ